MDIEVKIIKGIPVEQIKKFEDRVVYNTTVTTREYTKSRNAYPYRTGTLMKKEVASPIINEDDKCYALTSGVDYAVKVWNYDNVNWTNPSTLPQWYYNAFRQKGALLLTNAVINSVKEIK